MTLPDFDAMLVKPGDLLILRPSQELTPEGRTRLREVLEEGTKGLNIRVVIIDDPAFKVSVLRSA